jgi:hypothetical protein
VRPTLAFLIFLAAAACGAREAPAPAVDPGERFAGSFTPPPRDGSAEVVATVDGERIYAADVARVMAARGLEARAALDELVAAELLAGEARRRGLLDDPEVVDTRRRERVRALMRRDFEPSFDGPEDVPEAEVEEIYRVPRVRRYYDHGRYHGVAYVRAELKKDASPAEVAAARAAAQAFRELAVAARPQTPQELFALAGKLPPGMKVTAAPNQIFQTSIDGPAVKPFAEAAMALEKLGDLSPPTRTEWGWDVLMLTEIVPEVRASREEAFADIRKNRFEPSRRLAYERWVEAFLARVKIERNDALLEHVQVDSLVGMQ